MLRKICSARKVLPDNYDVARTLEVFEGNPFAYGGLSDGHRGDLNLHVDVFVKKLRVHAESDLERIKEVSHLHTPSLELLLTDELEVALPRGCCVETSQPSKCCSF